MADAEVRGLRRALRDGAASGLFTVARDAVAVEVAGDGGSVDAELHGELGDGGARSVGIKKVVEIGGGEASLGRV
ncbi:hypothetical protein [uncultured Ilumatobacter sp.]|uniref:hypothetical protein n=1 Tax=uncultured Ilumatobacter sp. TaxID=879968 RepID=UPI00374F86B4